MTKLGDNYVISKFFPTQVSATDIEMLVRSPYSFYAKKILGLKKWESLATGPTLSEFGNFIHTVIEQYSKTYSNSLADKLQHLLDISANQLKNSIFPAPIQRNWQTKFIPIAKEFIEFDEKRRKNNDVYSEIRGEMTIKVADLNIKIVAVADRIEVDNIGRVVIMDYKTGSIPTKKEVESGLSPQLVIEALICLAGGFGIQVNGVSSLIYVKIASNSPYIQTFEINLIADELKQHKAGMLSLLEYYVVNKKFSLEIDLLKHNDYRHLTRLL
jgi:ATP-dependent helicase/nuclease subunit B